MCIPTGTGVVAMRLYRVLLAPWVATPRPARWLFVVVLALVAAGDVLGRVYGGARYTWVLSAVVLGIANAACWLLLMPNGLMLVLAARRLRLPGISRDVLWSLPLYAAISIGGPGLLQIPQGHVLGFSIVQLLVATGAMIYLLMPAYCGIAMSMLPALHGGVRQFMPLPAVTDARFVPWGGMLVVLLLSVLAWRWRQLSRGDYVERGMRAPNLINFRRILSGASRDPLADAGALRARPDWLVARPDMHAVGAMAPVQSLRMALGGVYLPQSVVGRLYQLVPALLMLALIWLLLFVVTLGDHGESRLLHYLFSRDGFVVVSWLFAVLGLAIVMMPVEVLTLRWGRTNAEVPLLALLPGLSPAGDGKRVLLRTALQGPALRLGLLLLVGWVGAITLAVGWPVELAMLVVALGCLGYLCAMALCIFGGRPLSGFGKSLLIIGLFVLLSLTVLAPQLWGAWPRLLANRAHDALGITWLALGLLLLWLSRRGWRGLQQRPHPFQSN